METLRVEIPLVRISKLTLANFFDFAKVFILNIDRKGDNLIGEHQNTNSANVFRLGVHLTETPKFCKLLEDQLQRVEASVKGTISNWDRVPDAILNLEDPTEEVSVRNDDEVALSENQTKQEVKDIKMKELAKAEFSLSCDVREMHSEW